MLPLFESTEGLTDKSIIAMVIIVIGKTFCYNRFDGLMSTG